MTVTMQLPQCVASEETQEPLGSINPDWHAQASF